jgi:hypothetical protein
MILPQNAQIGAEWPANPEMANDNICFCVNPCNLCKKGHAGNDPK